MSGFKKFGYDLLPVMAGVLLALLINNFQQSRKQKNFVKKVVQTIVEENKANSETITDLLLKQQKTLDTLYHYTDDEKITVRDLLAKLNGLSTPNVINNGANFLINSNQTIIDVELLLLLAELNSEIDNYKRANEYLSVRLYDDLYSGDNAAKRRLALMLNDLMNYERNIKILGEVFNEKYGNVE